MHRLLVAALPLLIVTPAFAQDAPKGGGHQKSWDNAQTKADAEARAMMIFGQLDADHDGFITQSEVDAFSKMMGDNPRMTGRIAKMFADSDTNHDGKISAEEAKANADRAFDAADINHDGTLTPEERQAARQAAGDQRPPQQ